MSTTKKRFLTLALMFLIAGVVGYGWILSDRNKEKKLLSRQQEKLNAKFVKLDKLLSGETDIRSFAFDISGENWQKELAGYQTRKKTIRPDIFIASTACMSMGVTIFAYWLLLLIVRYITAGLSSLKEFSANIFRRQKQEGDNLLTEICLEEDEKTSQAPILSELYKSEEDILSQNELQIDESDKETENIDVLYCDENSLQSQDTNLEKQVAKFRQTAPTVKEATAEKSDPVETTLNELTQQVSAIREYTSYQHDRIEKLQEGYDWNIIRTFCLRIIRGIDNLENRISRLSEQDIDTTDLEEIMDELIFALESSGVEQFRPVINSDYRGQEKTAEVVKDKACSNDPDLKGKISEVIKPGYQYEIHDGNVKIVRTARVKLFG